MHLTRVIVAVIALPLFYLFIAKLSAGFFLGLLMLISILGQMEFHAMYRAKGLPSLIAMIGGIFFLLSGISPSSPVTPSGVVVGTFMAIAAARLFSIKDPSSSLRDLAPVAIGFLYIPPLLSSLWHLRTMGYEWILFLFSCVWASDSLAYYIGKGMGKKKLYPEVSPNKTVAGGVGSLIGGVLSALLIGKALLTTELWILAVMGLSIGAVTIVGDLVESMFKRDAGVKDSGSIIPGHGGVLDKIDGVLYAGPALYGLTRILL
ncbi:MAG: phosphatidate cytidylyltransferase [Nitrospirales bacterium]|nr:phosphatidate cytidylyltransferase [Nitrospirales bacterium]